MAAFSSLSTSFRSSLRDFAGGAARVLPLSVVLGLVFSFASDAALAQSSAGNQPRPISQGGATPLALPSVKMQAQLQAKPKKKKKKTMVEWRMRVSGKQWQNAVERSQYGELALDAKLDQVISDKVLMHGWVWAAMRSSYVQSRWNEIGGTNAFGVFEAFVQGQPVEALTFQAGILDQGKWDAPILLDMVPFPGVLESLKFGKEYSIEARAQQAIPTSKSLSAQTESSEPTPAFLMETLRVAAEPEGAPVHASAYAGLWSFQNLPAAAATDADGFGNTLIAGPDGKPRFKYQYEGWLAGGSTKFFFSKQISMNLHGQMLQNAKAPESYRNGQQAGAGFEFKLPNGIEILPSYDVFFAESDLSPSNYQQVETGHSNRIGWWASIGTIFRKQGFKVAGTVFDADTINASATQARQQFFILKFETLYGSL